MARLRPTFRAIATIGVWQNQPPLPPGAAKPADSAATARSQEATSWQPAAVARACTRATTTCGTSWMVCISSVHSSSRLRTSVSGCPATSAKSCPALNTGPSAASTMPVASLRAGLGDRGQQLGQVLAGERVAARRPHHRDADDVAVALDPGVRRRHADASPSAGSGTCSSRPFASRITSTT